MAGTANEPRRLDIHIAFLPRIGGSIQYGIRPVVIIQNDKGNANSSTVIIAPITKQHKNALPTHVRINRDTGVDCPSNLQIGRTIKRVFLERFKRELPFEKNERTPEKYILMTRFIGFDRRFYDSIPYLKGTFDIERTFQSVARKLHSMNGAYKLFKQSDLPDFKSVRRVFFSNAGLLFYLDECEKLWQAIADPNLFCDLMNHDCIFHILSILHQRPCLYKFVFDYSRLQGSKGLIKRITHEWSFSICLFFFFVTVHSRIHYGEKQRRLTR